LLVDQSLGPTVAYHREAGHENEQFDAGSGGLFNQGGRPSVVDRVKHLVRDAGQGYLSRQVDYGFTLLQRRPPIRAASNVADREKTGRASLCRSRGSARQIEFVASID
jgi:hypothetical protein